MATQSSTTGMERKDGRAGCLCDPLGLWERVQWKIVPIANPWQANYSFDPCVCMPMGVGMGGYHTLGLIALTDRCVLVWGRLISSQLLLTCAPKNDLCRAS